MHRRLLTVALLILACSVLPGCPRIVDTGEVGVSKSFGTINPEEIGVGMALEIPILRSISIRSVKIQEITMESNVPTSGGMMVKLDTTLLIRREADKVAEQFMTISDNPWDTLVIPQLRSQIRSAVSGQTIQQVYKKEGRVLIGEETASKLQEVLGPHGFIVEDFLLREVKLPETFKNAIDAKLAAEQKVQQKEFELQQAEKEALIEVARARGAAEAQEIVRSTLSGSYLQYLWIKTLNENPNVIYVATEANLPLFKKAK